VTSAADVTRLRTRTGSVVTLARRDLNRFWQSLDLTRPEAARDALLEYLPQLVTTYGDVAATVAADWYETARGHQVGGLFNAVTAVADPAAVEGSARYSAQHLFTDSPDTMLPVISGAMQRYIAGTSRATIGMNVRRDPAKPRYARIPTGAKTCAWCSMLSSRGFVYHSQKLAGFDGSTFHDDCDCQIVADWSEHPAIEGYDPGAAYELYSAARSASGATDQKSIVAEMRRMHPDHFTDGVTTN
jgi:hypothetical protein